MLSSVVTLYLCVVITADDYDYDYEQPSPLWHTSSRAVAVDQPGAGSFVSLPNGAPCSENGHCASACCVCDQEEWFALGRCEAGICVSAAVRGQICGLLTQLAGGRRVNPRLQPSQMFGQDQMFGQGQPGQFGQGFGQGQPGQFGQGFGQGQPGQFGQGFGQGPGGQLGQGQLGQGFGQGQLGQGFGQGEQYFGQDQGGWFG